MDNVFAQRVEALRCLMRTRGWDAVIISGSDPHCSEYPASRWKQVEWLSGFTGEAGDLVITLDHAGLWTDTRYFIQAKQQLSGTGVVLHKTRVPDQVLIPDWLKSTLDKDSLIAVDGLCQSTQAMLEISDSFELVSVPDMLSPLWENRSGIPQTPIITVDHGESTEEKLSWLRAVLEEKACDGMLVCSLDEIAWLLNVRGADIDFNPYVISYLYVGEGKAKWFVLKDEPEDPDTIASLEKLSSIVEILPYSQADFFLSSLQGTLLVDSSSLNYQLYKSISCTPVDCQSPIKLRKAVKNSCEQAGMRKAHILDGVAMEKFLCWLEKSLDAGKIIDERSAAIKLAQYRAQGEGYQGESFETISAYGQGAALPHYITPAKDAPILHQQGLYLNDSGAQYLFGTTDITRTVPLGECSRLEMEDYTICLKSHIDLAMAVFPEGTAGCQIDALAREPLWRAGRNFGHGTGHGVGCFLGVHEGPADIRQNFNSTPLLPGMILSDEPGIYREGQHGVRHENLLLCVELPSNEFGRWRGFEPLTLCHFETGALLREMLSPQEIEWLNNYHLKVRETLCPLLPQEVASWLEEKTKAL